MRADARSSGFSFLELMMVVLVIGILIAMTIPGLKETAMRKQVKEGLDLADVAKKGVAVYYALNGIMPVDNTQAGVPPPDKIIGQFNTAVTVKSGKIVTIGSMTSIFGLDMAAPYTATKGAVMQLTKSLASAWARDNIQVNCILPGWIDTDLTHGARRTLPHLQDTVVDRTPMKRWGRPEDLAGAALFYCSAASDFVTGTALPVDGGFSSSMF